MAQTTEPIDFNAIARDLDLCDRGEAMTTGRLRARYRAQRKVCLDAIRDANRADGLDQMTDEDLLRELGA